jgi:hypothetical protein
MVLPIRFMKSVSGYKGKCEGFDINSPRSYEFVDKKMIVTLVFD